MQFIMDVYCVQWENVWFQMILLYNMCPTEIVYTAAACKGPSLILRPSGLHALKATRRQNLSPGKPRRQQHLVWDTCNKTTWQWGKSWMVEKTGVQCCFVGKMGLKWYQLPAGPVVPGWESHLRPRDVLPPTSHVLSSLLLSHPGLASKALYWHRPVTPDLPICSGERGLT